MKEAHVEIETEHPGYLGSRNLLRRHHQGSGPDRPADLPGRTIWSYSRVATAKLYTDKSAITAADLRNDRVVPFFDAQRIKLHRILTDRGTEYCGKPEYHAYQLYLAAEDIDHSRTKANHPQTNGICERFHKTLQDECYSLLFRKKPYRSLEEPQPTWTLGWSTTTGSGPTQAGTATGRPPGAISGHRAPGAGKRLSRRGDQSDSTVLQHTAVG